MHILVVDDDPAIRGLLKTMIERLGHPVLTAEDGTAALTPLDDAPVNMVISDIDMPGLDGLELARHIRQRTGDRYVYTVLISGRSRATVATILDAGADDFICKPFDPAHLRARIRSAERICGLEDQLRVANAALTAQFDQIRGDMQQAERVQRLLMPTPRRGGGVAVEPYWQPSAFVSGDCFNAFEIGSGLYGFYLADVAGHGARAALIASGLLHSITPETFRLGVDRHGRHSAAAIARHLDRVHQSPDGEGYFTALIGLIDQSRGHLTLCQAGGPAPLLQRQDGGQCWIGGGGGFPIGLIDQARYEDVSLALAPGDRLILFSDGVADDAAASGETLSCRDLADLCCQISQLPLADFVRRLGAAVSAGFGAAAPGDDVTLLALEFQPTAARPMPTTIAPIATASR